MTRRSVQTKTTYLEMLDGPSGEPLNTPDRVSIERQFSPPLERYRSWYRRVGESLHWMDRLIMPDQELTSSIHDPRVEIHLLALGEEEAGYAELDRRQESEVELAYFGLFPEFCGKGLGRFFLNWVVHQAWSFQPRRVWVHTCDLDHPAALPNYLKAGFRVYDQQWIEQPIE